MKKSLTVALDDEEVIELMRILMDDDAEAALVFLKKQADEKHAKAHGEKWYVGTTVAQDCILGASVATTADADGLTAAYGVFQQEAQAIQPQYQPKTVNTDGWAATGKAWRTLFPSVVIILCFLHAFIKIRSRCKRLGDHYEQIKQQVWEIYHAADKDEFKDRARSLQKWVLAHRLGLTAYAIESIDKLCQRADQFCLTFDHPRKSISRARPANYWKEAEK
jgi:hypothetical protein